MPDDPSTAHPEERNELGDLLGEYRANPVKQLLVAGLGFLLSSLGAFALFLVVTVIEEDGLAGLKNPIFFGLILLVVGGFAIWFALFRMRRTRFLLYDGGFVYATPGSSQSFRWEDLSTVQLTEIEHRDRYGQIVYYSHVFQICPAKGEPIELDDRQIGDGEELGRTILRELRLSQLKELLKMALSMEAAGEVGPALAAYEQLFKESPYNQIGEQARERMERLRQSHPQDRP